MKPVLFRTSCLVMGLTCFAAPHAWACDGCGGHTAGATHTHDGEGGHAHASPSPFLSLSNQAASTRSGGALRFIVVADTQGNALNNVVEPFVPQLLADMSARNPAFVFFPGDLVTNGNAGGGDFAAWNNLTQPHFGNNRYMVPGNHDLPGRPSTNGDWQTAFNWLPDSQVVPNITTADPNDTISGIDQMDYYVDVAPGVRLISVTADRDLLPGESPSHTGGYEILGGEPPALDWFQSVMALESTQQMDHVFVMTHHPVTSQMSEVNSPIDLTEGTSTDWWQSIAGTHEGFDGATAEALFTGHIHAYYPNRPDPNSNTAEVIVGTGGGNSEGVPHRQRHGFMEVVIENGNITTTFYGDSNDAVGGWSFTEVLDTFTISENGGVPRGEQARYRFEAGAVDQDSSLSPLSKGHELHLNAGATGAVDAERGRVLALNGTGFVDAKNVGDQNFQIVGDLRLDLWARANGDLGGQSFDNVLVAFGDADGSRTTGGGHDSGTLIDEIANYNYILSYADDGRLRMTWEYHDDPDADATAETVDLFSTVAVADPDEWHRIEVLRDAEKKTLRFLVDGAPLGEDLSFDNLPTGGGAGSLYFGALPNTADGNTGGVATFRGWLDDIIISNELVTLFGLGDANQDGFVGAEDLDILLTNWGQDVTPGSLMMGDLNGDGTVGQADLALIQAHWGQGTPPEVSVPEPASLFTLGGAMLMCMRRVGR